MVNLENRRDINFDDQLNKHYETYFTKYYSENGDGSDFDSQNNDVSIGELLSHSQALDSLHQDIQKWAMNIEKKVKDAGSPTISKIIDSLVVEYLANLIPGASQTLMVVDGINNGAKWVKRQLVGFFEGFKDIVVNYKINPQHGGGSKLNVHVESDSLKDIVISEAEHYFRHNLKQYAIDKKEFVRYLVNASLAIIEDNVNMLKGLIK